MSLYVLLTIVVLLIAVVSLSNGDSIWISGVCWAVFALGVIGVADGLLSFVRLGDQALSMRKNFRMKVVQRADIESISASKGCPVQLIMADGGRIEVPSLGPNDIANSLRAWIRSK